jgi:6-phosphogluconolactonase
MGSYTEFPIPDFGGIGHGIYTVQLNPDTGELEVKHSKKARNPSYLCISDDNQYLYCNTELDEKEEPKVRGYRIQEDFSLEFINEQPIQGGYPCHLLQYRNQILVACYATGNVLQFPLKESGELMSFKKNYYHAGSSVNKARQEAPHAHQVAIHPNSKDIYVCDLGIDTLKAYSFEGDEMLPNTEKDTGVSLGGGPRHMVFNKSGSLAYVINELTGNVSVLQNKNGNFQELHTYASIPTGFQGLPSASAIRIDNKGKFLYVANRNLEAISIFCIEEDRLSCLDHQYTKGNELREFNISPDGKWLIACHQNSHDTVVYKIKGNGKLSEKYRTKEILSPVCVVFPE